MRENGGIQVGFSYWAGALGSSPSDLFLVYQDKLLVPRLEHTEREKRDSRLAQLILHCICVKV